MDSRISYPGLAVAFIVGVVIALVVFTGDDEPDSGGEVQSTQSNQGRVAEDSRPTGKGAFGGPEGRSAADAVTQVYGGLQAAAAKKVMPLDVDPRTALEQAEDVDGLRQICNRFSEDARADTIRWVKAFARLADVDWTCEKAVALLIRNSRTNRGLKRSLQAKVVGINIAGDHGTATLDFGKGEPLSSISIVKEGDSWKIGAPLGQDK